MIGVASLSIFFNKVVANSKDIKHGIIIQSVISNKVAKPFLINIKTIKYITNNFYIVNTRVTAELLQKGNQIVNYTVFPV